MNSIRTPRKGTNANSRRIAEAVDDEDWQKFRVSLKGLSTRDKLNNLCEYWNQMPHTEPGEPVNMHDCDVCIRIDNYIKALCRGGQLVRGATLQGMIRDDWSSNWIIR